MVLQIEIYWHGQALSERLKESPLDLSKVKLVSDRLLELCNKANDVAGSMREMSLEYSTSYDDDIRAAAGVIRAYASAIVYNVNGVASAAGRIQVLAMATGDPLLQGKLMLANDELDTYLRKLADYNWHLLSQSRIAVTHETTIVTANEPDCVSMYPEHAWGCINECDRVWAEWISQKATGDSSTTYVSPLVFFERLNIPNYLLWICLQETYSEAHSAMRRTMQERAIESILALTTEEDMSGVEDNSPFPEQSLWDRVEVLLPPGMPVPLIRRKTRETTHDKLADKSAVASTQLMLMCLTSE